MTTPINLGAAADGAACMDLEELLASRLLVQGNSGSGKSHLLRRLLEQSAALVQQVVIDPEGDFVGLAERFGHLSIEAADYSVAEVASIAARVRQHRVSVVLNLEGLEVDAQLRCAAGFLHRLVEAPPLAPLHVEAGVPAFVADLLQARFGADWMDEARALIGDRAPLDLRLNTLRGGREAALRLLAHDGLEPAPTPWSALGLRLPAALAPDIQRTRAWLDGWVEVAGRGEPGRRRALGRRARHDGGGLLRRRRRQDAGAGGDDGGARSLLSRLRRQLPQGGSICCVDVS